MEKLKSAQNCQNIDEIREQIDALDSEILKLFAQRKTYVDRIVDYKHSESDIIAEQRQAKVLDKIKMRAQSLGLEPEVFASIYQTLIQHNIREELKLFTKNHK